MFHPAKFLPLHAAALLAFVGLGSAIPSAAAQNLTCTLSNVVFSDGGVASGTITFDPATETVVSYNLTTTNGATGPLVGTNYLPSNSTTSGSVVTQHGFDFSKPVAGAGSTKSKVTLNSSSPPKVADFSMLIFNVWPFPTGPGTYRMVPGNVLTSPLYQLQDSGEFATSKLGARALVTGDLVVTVASVPVINPTVSITAAAKKNGGFLVQRTIGRSDVAVTVAYRVGGSAIGGNDYETLSGTMTIPANANEAVIPVRPLRGADLKKTVSVTLDASLTGSYTLGTAQGSLTLRDL